MLKRRRLLIAVLCHVVAWSGGFIPAFAVAGSSLSIQINTDAPRAVENKSAKKGLPDHAPAHGYRAKHSYQYYPNADVYFDTGSRMYFFLSSGIWKMSAILPINLRTTLGSHVMIDMNSDKPYSDHEHHRAQYAPGHSAQHKPEKKHEKGNHGKDK